MSRRQAAHVFLGLSLAAFLSAPSVEAKSRRTPGEALPSYPLTRLWDAITAVLGDAGLALHGWATSPLPISKEGCILDPHGGCTANSAPTPSEAGCIADPHGGCIRP